MKKFHLCFLFIIVGATSQIKGHLYRLEDSGLSEEFLEENPDSSSFSLWNYAFLQSNHLLSKIKKEVTSTKNTENECFLKEKLSGNIEAVSCTNITHNIKDFIQLIQKATHLVLRTSKNVILAVRQYQSCTDETHIEQQLLCSQKLVRIVRDLLEQLITDLSDLLAKMVSITLGTVEQIMRCFIKQTSLKEELHKITETTCN